LTQITGGGRVFFVIRNINNLKIYIMQVSRFSPATAAMLVTLNESNSLNIFLHEKEGCIIEVQTSLVSPYVLIEVEIESETNGLIKGKIVDIWASQPDSDATEIYCNDLRNWQRTSIVEISLKPIQAEGGKMTKVFAAQGCS
jgi:hypothetical protein